MSCPLCKRNKKGVHRPRAVSSLELVHMSIEYTGANPCEKCCSAFCKQRQRNPKSDIDTWITNRMSFAYRPKEISPKDMKSLRSHIQYVTSPKRSPIKKREKISRNIFLYTRTSVITGKESKSYTFLSSIGGKCIEKMFHTLSDAQEFKVRYYADFRAKKQKEKNG